MRSNSTWNQYTTGSDRVIVAVVDGGVDLTHPDLAANCIPAGGNGSWPTGKRDEEGKPKMCKDIKDFCMYYKKGHIDPYKEFRYKLVKLAKSMKFWLMTEDEDGKRKYEISNAHLYRFLSASGFHKMPTNSADAWEFVYEHDRVVEVIPEKAIVARVKEYLINFIRSRLDIVRITQNYTQLVLLICCQVLVQPLSHA